MNDEKKFFTNFHFVDLLEQDFLNRICSDDKSHMTQSLSKLPEYKTCSSALNRSAITVPLRNEFVEKFFVHFNKKMKTH